MKPLISLHDYGRPWKLFTLTYGIALLIAGSYWQPAPDWDVPISLIMGVGTYFFLRARQHAHCGAAALEAAAAGVVSAVAVRGRCLLGVLVVAKSGGLGANA